MINADSLYANFTKKVLPLWQITFDPLKLGSKVIYQRGKTYVFHQKSEDILHSLFAGTSNQKMRALPSAGTFHQNLRVIYLLQVITLRFRRKFQYIFQTKFFPLKSAFRCPHLTTVYLLFKLCEIRVKWKYKFRLILT